MFIDIKFLKEIKEKKDNEKYIYFKDKYYIKGEVVIKIQDITKLEDSMIFLSNNEKLIVDEEEFKKVKAKVLNFKEKDIIVNHYHSYYNQGYGNGWWDWSKPYVTWSTGLSSTTKNDLTQTPKTIGLNGQVGLGQTSGGITSIGNGSSITGNLLSNSTSDISKTNYFKNL